MAGLLLALAEATASFITLPRGELSQCPAKQVRISRPELFAAP